MREGPVGTVAGDAVGGQDYVPIKAAVPVTLEWEDGDATSRVVLIKLIKDEVFEADESFNVVLLETMGAGQGNDATAIVITETPVNADAHKPTGCAGATGDGEATPAVAAKKARTTLSSVLATTDGPATQPAPMSPNALVILGSLIAAVALAATLSTFLNRSAH